MNGLRALARLVVATSTLAALVLVSPHAGAQQRASATQPATASSATAPRENIFTPGTRPVWAALGVGPSITLGGSGSARPGLVYFRLAPQIGYHFSGRTDGPAIAGEINMLIATNLFTMLFGGRFYYDIPVAGTGLLLAPNAGFSVGFVNVALGVFGLNSTSFVMEIPIGFDVRFVVANRVLAFIRPVGINIAIVPSSGSTSVSVLYDLLFGGGVTF